MANDDSKANLERLSEQLIKQHWDFYPTAGSRIGRHEYDGQLPELSPQRIRRRVEELRRGLAQLSSIPQPSQGSAEQLSYRMLQLFLQRELFTLNELRPLENNPMRQVGYLNVGGYVRRDYAPLADRLRSATQALLQVPEFLEVLNAALVQDIGRPILEMSIESYAGMASFYRKDLGAAVVDFDPKFKDRTVLADFDQAREEAAKALDRFVVRLQEHRDRAGDEFAIGSKMFASMLAQGEGVAVPIAELVALGQANLDSNLDRLAQAAASIGPERSVGEIVEVISQGHPSAQELIPATRDMLEDLRQTLIDLDLISVPSEDRCQVMETPTYMRYAFAAMDSAGALETKATESFYYVTPVEDDWTAQQREEWLSNFNYDTLKVISIHEVYPGHFVHHLHNLYGRDLPLVNRVATSYAFTEGWAHYTEQMMLETKYGEGKPKLLLTQLLEALVRNCRYMCSLWLHTEGMTLEDATRFFVDNAYMAELPARREALRGTFDPGYLNYTLGKLMILKLREDYRREQGSAFSLKEFHDRLLSFGGPALPLLRPVLLDNTGDSAI